MPTFPQALYRGGYNYGPWPRDFEQYLFNRAAEGRDCELSYDGSLVFVMPVADRGLSLFDVRGTLNAVWRAPAQTAYPGDLTLTPHPTIAHDHILAPGSKMLIGTFIDLVEQIQGWASVPAPFEPAQLPEGDKAMNTEHVALAALRNLIATYDREIGAAGDENRRVALTNDRQSLHNMVDAFARGGLAPTSLSGTHRALMIEALDGVSAAVPAAAKLRATFG